MNKIPEKSEHEENIKTNRDRKRKLRFYETEKDGPYMTSERAMEKGQILFER